MSAAPEVRFESTPEWLFVHVRGTFDLAWFKGFIGEVAGTAKAKVPPPRAILVDARELTGGRLSAMDRFDLEEAIAWLRGG